MKLALESKYVSDNLHNWINLIFGVKQKGKGAVESFNLFHNLTYHGNVDLSKIKNVQERKMLESQISEFGITPLQIFKEAHPKRFSTKIVNLNYQNVVSEIEKEDEIIIKESDEVLKADYHEDKEFPSVKLTEPLPTRQKPISFNFNFKHFPGFHFKGISSIDIFDSVVATAGYDGFIKLFDYKGFSQDKFLNSNTKVFQIHESQSLSKVFQLNSNLVVCGDIDGSIHVYNHRQGKHMTSVNSHNDKITGLFSFDSTLITVSEDSTCNLYSLNSNLKVPIDVLNDWYSAITASTFRIYDSCLAAIDSTNFLCMRNVKTNSLIHKTQLAPDQQVKYISYNPLNDNEYYICTEESFDVYDFRTHTISHQIDYFYNTESIYNDSTGFLVVDKCGVQQYISSNTQQNLSVKNKSNKFSSMLLSSAHSNATSCRNFSFVNNILAIGCDNGDLYLSSEK